MSYSVRFEGIALVQLNGLPSVAFDAIVERVTDLVKEPWDAVIMPPGDDPAYRITVFGSGLGLLTFTWTTLLRPSGSSTSPGSASLLDLPTVRFGLRWARSPLVAGHVAGNSFGRIARRSLNRDRDSATASAIASRVRDC
jgi:hypothetical protein